MTENDISTLTIQLENERKNTKYLEDLNNNIFNKMDGYQIIIDHYVSILGDYGEIFIVDDKGELGKIPYVESGTKENTHVGNNNKIEERFETLPDAEAPTENIFSGEVCIYNYKKEIVNHSKITPKIIHDVSTIATANNYKKHAKEDGLTNLLNKRGYANSLEDTIKHYNLSMKELTKKNIAKLEKDAPEKVSLICFDCNYFKQINDLLGHDTGDVYLKMVAESMQDCTKHTDVKARDGGDEFKIIFYGNETQAYKKAEEIRMDFVAKLINAKLDEGSMEGKIKMNEQLVPIIVDLKTNKEYHIGICSGIAEYVLGEEAKDFRKRADKALYFSKDTLDRQKTTKYSDMP